VNLFCESSDFFREACGRTGCAVNRCMGRKIEVEATAGHKVWFLPSNFCAHIKVAPMVRAMPAIT